MADHNGGRMREDWKSQAFRSKIVGRLDDEMKKNQTPMPKSSIEMEEYVFQKAGSREEYLDLVARVLLSVSNERRSQVQGQNPGVVPNQGPQDPIGALQNLTGQAASGMERPASSTECLVDNERLVAAVHKRVALYDKDDARYSNRSYIRQQWRNVAREIGTDAMTAKKKWTSLRDYYSRRMRLVPGQTPGGNKRKWYLFDKMSFLNPHMSDKFDDENVTMKMMCDYEDLDYNKGEMDLDSKEWVKANSSSNDDNNQSMGDHDSDLEDDDDDGDDDDAGGNNLEDSVDPVLPQASSRQDYQVPDHSHHPPHSANLLSKSQSTSLSETFRLFSGIVDQINGGKEKNNEEECFMKSLVPSMKLLDPISKLECQGEINDIVLKYLKKSMLSSILGTTEKT